MKARATVVCGGCHSPLYKPVRTPASHFPPWPVDWHSFLNIPHGGALVTAVLPTDLCLTLSTTLCCSGGLLSVSLPQPCTAFQSGESHGSHRQPLGPSCGCAQPMLPSLRNSRCPHEFNDNLLVRGRDSLHLRHLRESVGSNGFKGETASEDPQSQVPGDQPLSKEKSSTGKIPASLRPRRTVSVGFYNPILLHICGQIFA